VTFTAYMLRCSDDSYYLGHTNDLEKRVGEHQLGAIPGYTRFRRPVELAWSENFSTRDEAVTAEQQIKGWSRAKKEALIRGDWDAVSALAKKRASAFRYAASTSSAAAQDEPLRKRGAPPPPAIVLVRPQLGENIGKAARAMLNFGLTELRLVSPRDGWPNPAAGPAASGANVVLERAQLFDNVADAVADCAHVYATTVRRRGLIKPVKTPEEAARSIRAETGPSALLFGPERSGLGTDDVAIARTIITVPINPEFGSLNLAQAVILCAYEWSKGEALAQPPALDLDPPAAQDELDGLVDHFDRLLEQAGYFFPPDRVPATKRTLRSVLTKPGWNAQEVRTLRGVLSALERPRRR
jgi:tRNA/rRNA methyltransferase